MKKNIPKYFLSLVFTALVNVQGLYASKMPPIPKGGGGFDGGGVVGSPIDDSLPYLMAIAILYGLFSVVKTINENIKITE